jgi:hypothetical protein
VNTLINNKFTSLLFFLVFGLLFPQNISSQENWSGNTTPTYIELITHLKEISSLHSELELYNMGTSDYGLPIYVCIVNGAKDSANTFKKAREETTILFNNAIHPGEPDGINACLIWLEEILNNKKSIKNLPVVAFIPAYNIGGILNRSSNSRANQNGPNKYGFRGNAQNLDLNRDFIKMDSENSFTFTRLFHGLDPDVFVDNHVSNGADYQYILTYISSLRERLTPGLNNIIYDRLLPYLEKNLKENHNIDLFPYVDLKGKTPNEGIVSFNDLPRYAMGYGSLFHSISFTVETHMLKPFPERVEATLAFMKELINWTSLNKSSIENSRNKARRFVIESPYLKYNYINSYKKDSILFSGYEHSFPIHKITGLKRLKYDTTKPYTSYVPYYNSFTAKDSVKTPDLYYISAQEKDIIKRLKANKVEMTMINKDTLMLLGVYKVVEFSPSKKPYEGHFKLNNIKVQRDQEQTQLKKGDWMINSNQDAALFIHSVLQPELEDAYLSWNFFDSYLQQKEYFSSYVFIDKIEEILNNDLKLKKEYELKKKEDNSFASSEWDQLYFIYKRSKYFEKSYNRLPVYYTGF